jgi:hypothetical protein
LNTESWDDVSDIEAAFSMPSLSPEEAARFLTTPYTYMARLQIKYEIQTPT